MKIALFGATGMVGSRIAAEATARGHEVTALSCSTGGDLADPDAVRTAAQAHDVVVSATGPSRTGESHDPWLAAVSTLIEQAGEARVLFVGGAGSLHTPDGTRLLDTDGFPEEYKAEATSGAAALDTPAGDFISAEDYAVALVDEVEQPQHRRQRFTAATATA